MERLWTPWRYDYVTRTKGRSRPGVPPALSAWPGPGRGESATPARSESATPAPGGPATPAPSANPLAQSDGSPDPASDGDGCVFCNMIAAVDYAIAQGMAVEDAERAVHLVARGPTCFLCLNAFPYSTGHVLLVPYRHVDSLAALQPDEAQEMIALAQHVERALSAVYRPAGMNFGLNLGQAGGAGIAGHLHMHALPRWLGDTNFMTVTADTRVLPEALDTTWERLRAVWNQ